MIASNKDGTALTLRIGNRSCEWSYPNTDVPLERLMIDFSSALIGHTWPPELVYRAMYEYAKEELRTYDEHEDE